MANDQPLAAVVAPTGVLSEIQDNGQDANIICAAMDEDDNSELTDLERQIVAKYLMELEGGAENEKEQFDVNNNSKEDQTEEKTEGQSLEDKENRGDSFPVTVPKEEIMALSMLLRQFPQLNRSTSLESSTSATGDSVEDLVSACPQLVTILKQAATAATATSSPSVPSPPAAPVHRATENSPGHSSRSLADCNPSSTSAEAAPATANASLASGCVSPSNNQKRHDQVGERPSKGRNARASSREKAVKKRPNYSVWMGVTSCLWGLLFYLMKNYL